MPDFHLPDCEFSFIFFLTIAEAFTTLTLVNNSLRSLSHLVRRTIFKGQKMQWHVDTKSDASVSTFVVTGDLDANDVFQLREQVRLYQVAQGGLSVLLDMRDAVLHIGTLDVFAIASTHQDVFPRGVPFAILTGPATMPPGDARFLENVLVNRGTLAKLFADEAAAREWLQAFVAEHQP